jgi:hypothetical protein
VFCQAECERELDASGQVAELLRHKLESAEHDYTDWKQRAMVESTRCQEVCICGLTCHASVFLHPWQYRNKWQDRDKLLMQRSAELRKSEENLLRAQKDLEKQSAKLKAALSSSGPSRPGLTGLAEVDRFNDDAAKVCFDDVRS